MKVKNIRFAFFLLLLALSAGLAACDDFERNAYRTLKVAKVEYELLQEHAARAFLAGRLTQEQWDRFAVAGNRFIAAHTLAADLMKTYQQIRRAGGADARDALERIERQVTAALAELPVLLADLRVLLETFERAAVSETNPPRPPSAGRAD
ncbi:MAG: hypothetical protein HYY26_04395 [Acidobacteria bacterium]|nr:hypothetical protein [Acidobacteriota bacterium]